MFTPQKTRRGLFVVSFIFFLALFVVLQSNEVHANSLLDNSYTEVKVATGTYGYTMDFSPDGMYLNYYSNNFGSFVFYELNNPYNISSMNYSETSILSLGSTTVRKLQAIDNGNRFLIYTRASTIRLSTYDVDFPYNFTSYNGSYSSTGGIRSNMIYFYYIEEKNKMLTLETNGVYIHNSVNGLGLSGGELILNISSFGGVVSKNKASFYYDDEKFYVMYDNKTLVEYSLNLTDNSVNELHRLDLSSLGGGHYETLFVKKPYVFFTSTTSSTASLLHRLEFDSINNPPNNATDIKPFNTTITLNSSGVSFPINWSGGDDDDGDTVTTTVYINFLGDKTFIGNTTSKSITATLNNTFLTSSFYAIYLNLSDGKNTTISEGGNFGLCVNEWISYNTSCIDNLHTLLYNDSNSCPLQYDLPSNNGTISACDVGVETGSSVDVQLNIDYVFIILLLITVFLIFTAFTTKSLTIFFLSIVFISLLTITFYNTYEETLILVGGALAVLSLLIALMKNYV